MIMSILAMIYSSNILCKNSDTNKREIMVLIISLVAYSSTIQSIEIKSERSKINDYEVMIENKDKEFKELQTKQTIVEKQLNKEIELREKEEQQRKEKEEQQRKEKEEQQRKKKEEQQRKEKEEQQRQEKEEQQRREKEEQQRQERAEQQSNSQSVQENTNQINGLMSTPNKPETNGLCKDGTPASGDPSARGRANSCYGHGGWQR